MRCRRCNSEKDEVEAEKAWRDVQMLDTARIQSEAAAHSVGLTLRGSRNVRHKAQDKGREDRLRGDENIAGCYDPT